MAEQAALEARRACEHFLEAQLSGVDAEGRLVAAAALRVEAHASHGAPSGDPDGVFGMKPFFIQRGTSAAKTKEGVPCTPFELTAPSTARNATRVLRALQVRYSFG